LDAIKRLRQQKNLTQAELAQKLGVTQSVVAMWERDARIGYFRQMSKSVLKSNIVVFGNL